MKKIMVFAVLMLLATSAAFADTLFRWVDNDGNVHYGDRPESDAVKVEAKKFTAPVISDDDTLPYESRVAKQNFPVTLYVAEKCGDVCVEARAFLNKRGIPFVEKFLATNEDIEAFMQASAGNAIPTLAVGKAFLKGFETVQWGNALDYAGYPKTAPYGVRPVAPSTQPPQPESAVAPAVPAE